MSSADAEAVGVADAVARWTAHLDAVEAALATDPASAPDHAGLPPLPESLAPRAAGVLDAVRATATDLAARRDAVARELGELRTPRPRPTPSGPVYLDTTG